MFHHVHGRRDHRALASILASLLVGGSSSADEEEAPAASPVPPDENELTVIRNELTELRKLMEKISAEKGL